MKRFIFILVILLTGIFAYGQKISTLVEDGDTIETLTNDSYISLSELDGTPATVAIRMLPMFTDISGKLDSLVDGDLSAGILLPPPIVASDTTIYVDTPEGRNIIDFDWSTDNSMVFGSYRSYASNVGGYFQVDTSYMSFGYHPTGAGGYKWVQFTDTAMRVIDVPDSKGFVYGADYSSNFTARSLVDKGYVDDVADATLSDSLGFIGGVYTEGIDVTGTTETDTLVVTNSIDLEDDYGITFGEDTIGMGDGDLYLIRSANELALTGGKLDVSGVFGGAEAIYASNTSSTVSSSAIYGGSWEDGSNTGSFYGIWGSASGSNSNATKIGVYGTASGGGTNIGVYSSGDVWATGNAIIMGAVYLDSAINFAADAQADDDYEISLPYCDALTTGMMVTFTANTANTGAATLEVTLEGTQVAIKKMHDQDLASNDIESGQVVVVVYDGTYWQMISQLAQ